MRDRIQRALARSKADYTEIRLESTESTLIVNRAKDREPAVLGRDSGGFVRCLYKDRGWGVVSFNDLDDLDREVAAACECARIGERTASIELAEIPIIEQSTQAQLADDFRGRSLKEKIELTDRYRNILIGHDSRITDCTVYYMDKFVTRTYANSDGAYIHGEHPRILCMLQAHAQNGGELQNGWEGRGGPKDYSFVNDMDELALSTAQRAVDLLEAKPVVPGLYPVIIDPTLTGIFIHEAFGHLSEADGLASDPNAKEMMSLGRRVGSESLNVFDDGTLLDLDGGSSHDDEGTPTRHTTLVKDGVLVGRLHSRATAALFGEEPTGNARAMNYRHAPIVRMTNTAVASGKDRLSDMIAGIDLGVLACGSSGGMTAMETFSFNSTHGFMIRKGKVAELIRPVSLAGNLFETLHNIDAVGDEFNWVQSPGGCGKLGQFPVPVDEGGPHLRIRDTQVGSQ